MTHRRRRLRSPRPHISHWEPFETSVLCQLLNPGDTVINIGAHRGHYTLAFASIVGEQGRVFAFEPDPTNFNILSQKVISNGLTNIVLEQMAVSNRTGKLRLYLNPKNPGDHRTYDSLDGRQFIEVEAISLNDYFKCFMKTIKLIKMDIQGSEPAALEGMSALLQSNKSLQLATEFWSRGLKTFGVDPLDYLRMLQSYSFSLVKINEVTRTLEPITDLNSLLSYYTPESNRYTNLLCTR